MLVVDAQPLAGSRSDGPRPNSQHAPQRLGAYPQRKSPHLSPSRPNHPPLLCRPVVLVPPSKQSRPAPPIQPNICRVQQPLRGPPKRRTPRGSDTSLRRSAPLRAGNHARTLEVLGRRPPRISRRALAASAQVQGPLARGNRERDGFNVEGAWGASVTDHCITARRDEGECVAVVLKRRFILFFLGRRVSQPTQTGFWRSG